MRVQLLTFPGCPNASATRELLQRVIAAANAEVEVQEVNTAAPDTPEKLRGWGSPTILIDGVDIEGQEAPAGSSCRLYRDPSGYLRGVPAESTLKAAVERSGDAG